MSAIEPPILYYTFDQTDLGPFTLTTSDSNGASTVQGQILSLSIQNLQYANNAVTASIMGVPTGAYTPPPSTQWTLTVLDATTQNVDFTLTGTGLDVNQPFNATQAAQSLVPPPTNGFIYDLQAYDPVNFVLYSATTSSFANYQHTTPVTLTNNGQGCACDLCVATGDCVPEAISEVTFHNDNLDNVDPVNGFSGQFQHWDTDISLPQPGLPFQVTRLHQTQQLINSMMPEVCHWNVVSWVDEAATGAHFLKLTYPSGRWAEFQSSDGVHFTPTAAFGDITDTVTKNADGSLDLLSKLGTRTHFIFYLLLNGVDNIYLIAGMQDQFGNSLTWHWQDGALQSITGNGGRYLTFNMAAVTFGGQSTAASPPFPTVQINNITDNLGRVWSYSGYQSFAGMGMAPTVCTYPGNRTWTYTYSGQGRLLTITDPNGHLTVSNTYDPTQTQVLSQTRANGDTWAFTYSTDGNGHEVTTMARTQNGTPQGTETFVYDQATGNQVSHTDGLGYTTTCQHDPVSGRLLSETTPLGETTTYQYDTRGNLLATTNALGNTWTVQYDPVYSTITQVTSPLGQVWTLQRDSLGDLTMLTDPLGHQTTFSYNSPGQVTATTNAVNLTWTQTYNAAGDLVTTTNPLQETTTLTVDGEGRGDGGDGPLGAHRLAGAGRGRPGGVAARPAREYHHPDVGPGQQPAVDGGCPGAAEQPHLQSHQPGHLVEGRAAGADATLLRRARQLESSEQCPGHRMRRSIRRTLMMRRRRRTWWVT